jgi:hypothetical protein
MTPGHVIECLAGQWQCGGVEKHRSTTLAAGTSIRPAAAASTSNDLPFSRVFRSRVGDGYYQVQIPEITRAWREISAFKSFAVPATRQAVSREAWWALMITELPTA